MRGALAALAALAALVVSSGAGAQETFDVSAYEKKAFEWKGFVEARPERQQLRPGSPGYLLQYPGDTRTDASRFAAAAELSGLLRSRALSFAYTGHARWIDEPRGTSGDLQTYEAFGAWQVDTRTNVEVGKRALRWGKGYAWSPVAFLERPRDPTDPELAREGFTLATGSYVRSFGGPLRTVALTAAAVPTASGLNPDFGAPGHTNPAIKLYGLLYDTDVDLIWTGRGSRGPRLGVDFSRNLLSNLEIHGEWARSRDATRALLGPGNTLSIETRDVDSALIGTRYLTQHETTIIFELYRNGGGYGRDELRAFYDLAYATAAQPALLPAAGRAAAQGYSRPNAARRYAYLRVSQKEPFGVLDFTPAVTLIANLDDHGWSAIPELIYTGVRNLELRLRVALNGGDGYTEFGARPVRSRVEIRARYFF
jgi:hypothetical protein